MPIAGAWNHPAGFVNLMEQICRHAVSKDVVEQHRVSISGLVRRGGWNNSVRGEQCPGDDDLIFQKKFQVSFYASFADGLL